MIVDFSKFKILVVDDEKYALKLMKMILHDLGVTQIFTADDGIAALHFLGDCEDLVNLIICDWNMPRMTGIELLQQVRAVDPNVLFMMVTGRATIDSVKEARAYNINAYVAKPFSPEQLEQKLLTLLRELDKREHRRIA